MLRIRHSPPPCRPLGADSKTALQSEVREGGQVGLIQRFGFQFRLEVVVVHDLKVRLRS